MFNQGKRVYFIHRDIGLMTQKNVILGLQARCFFDIFCNPRAIYLIINTLCSRIHPLILPYIKSITPKPAW